jgi:hypothetical protein
VLFFPGTARAAEYAVTTGQIGIWTVLALVVGWTAHAVWNGQIGSWARLGHSHGPRHLHVPREVSEAQLTAAFMLMPHLWGRVIRLDEHGKVTIREADEQREVKPCS